MTAVPLNAFLRHLHRGLAATELADQTDRQLAEPRPEIQRECALVLLLGVHVGTARAVAAEPAQSVDQQRVPEAAVLGRGRHGKPLHVSGDPRTPEQAVHHRFVVGGRDSRVSTRSGVRGLAQRERVEPPELVEGRRVGREQRGPVASARAPGAPGQGR